MFIPPFKKPKIYTMGKKRLALASILIILTGTASFAEGFGVGFNRKISRGIIRWGTDTSVYLSAGVDVPGIVERQRLSGDVDVGMDFPVLNFSEGLPLTIGWMIPVSVNIEEDSFECGVAVLATIGFQYTLPGLPLKLYMRFGVGPKSNLAPAFNVHDSVRIIYNSVAGIIILI